MCHGIWQIKAKKIIHGGPILTSVVWTSACCRKRGMNYSSQLSQHAISNSLQKFSSVFFDLQLRPQRLGISSTSRDLLVEKDKQQETVIRTAFLTAVSPFQTLLQITNKQKESKRVCQGAASIKSFHSWFQSRMQHYEAGLTCPYLRSFTSTTTQMPAHVVVTCVTCFCIIPQRNTQHTLKQLSWIVCMYYLATYLTPKQK